MDFGIPAPYYLTIFMLTLLPITFYYASVVRKIVPNCSVWMNKSFAFFYATAFILFVGLRPIHLCFGDMGGYAIVYDMMMGEKMVYSHEGDWLFYRLMFFCVQIMPSTFFFLLMELLFVSPIIIAVKRMLPQYIPIVLFVWFGSFTLWGSAVNGIRSGIALSFVVLAITLIDGSVWDKIKCAILLLCALGFHKSSMLPIASLLFVKLFSNPKAMFSVWLLSIPLSFIFGNAFTSFFSDLGFDDRFSVYTMAGRDLNTMASNFSRIGFRWDFLLYSAMPVLLGWYVIEKRHFVDKTYLLLLGTYIYANAFWIMVIRSSFSNRFAGLSWFLYPFVLAYPLLKFPVFKSDHSRKTSYVMLANFGFTFFMWLIGK